MFIKRTTKINFVPRLVKFVTFLILLLPIDFSLSAFSQIDTSVAGIQISVTYFNRNSIEGVHAEINPVQENMSQFKLGIKSVTDSNSLEIGSSHFSPNGVAEIEFPGEKYIQTTDGQISITCYLLGAKSEKLLSRVLTITPIQLKMELLAKEGKKIIRIAANEILSNSLNVPVNDMDIQIFTPTLFGNMLVAEGYILKGNCEIDFPAKLPGDTAKVVKLIGILENQRYGIVSSASQCNWGSDQGKINAVSHHKLWTMDPPIWMLVSLIIVLGGIWAVYLFVFIKIRKIIKAGKTL